MVLPVCSHCKTPISGSYFKDYWGNLYHGEHLNRVPRCRYCGRLLSDHLTRGGRTYPDGRVICGLCLPMAVTDLIRARELLRYVHDELDLLGIQIHPFKPKLHLIDRKKLRTLDSSTETQGFAKLDRLAVNGRITRLAMEIYLLSGLPESSFITTAAHELMHIWLYGRNVPAKSPKMIEGSCNYASYLVLKRLKTPEAAYRIQELLNNPDPVYGGGFRRVHRLVESRGIPGWLNYIQRKNRLPLF